MRAGAGAFCQKPSHDRREKKMTQERSETLPELVAGLASQLALPDFPKTERADGVKVKRDELRENCSGGAGGPRREEW